MKKCMACGKEIDPHDHYFIKRNLAGHSFKWYLCGSECFGKFWERKRPELKPRSANMVVKVCP